MLAPGVGDDDSGSASRQVADRKGIAAFLFRTAEYTGLQVVVQAIGFAIGLAVIRTLSKDEYASFTVASSVAGTVAVLSDLGLSSALLSAAGRRFHDRAAASGVFGVALEVNAWLSVAAVVLGTAAGLVLLRGHGASVVSAVALSLAAGLAGVGSSRYALATIAPRLDSDLRQLQRVDLAAVAVRAALTGAALAAAPLAFAVLLVNGAVLVGQASWLRRRNPPAPVGVERARAERKELLGLVWRQTPPSLLYLFHGQLTVWLITLTGTGAAVADYGALGRLAAVLTIVTSVVNAIALPHFARSRSASELLRAFAVLAGALGALVVAGTLGAALLPGPALWLLGAKYGGLQAELVPMVCAALLTTTASALYGMNLARGWTLPVATLTGTWLVAVLSGLALFDLATVKGAAWFNCWTMAMSITTSSALFLHNARNVVPMSGPE